MIDKIINKIRKIKLVISGKDFFYRTSIQLNNVERLGSKYGGWWIYIPPIQSKQATVFSFGLGEDISFSLTIIRKYNAKVYGFDPTPKSLQYVKSINTGKNFSLYKYALANQDGQLTFNLPINDNHVSGSFVDIKSKKSILVEAKRLKTILKDQSIKINKIDILKMDIEGAEYDTIKDIIKSNIFPDQILVEYHHFFNSISTEKTKNSIEFLLRNGYELFYIENYNYSFIKKELIDK